MEHFLQRHFFCAFTKEVMNECYPFTCGKDDDMDEFFLKDVHKFSFYRFGKSYCFRSVENPKRIAAIFTVANDSIRLFDLGSSKKNKMWKEFSNREKRLSRYPGVLIGRLAVSEEYAGQGVGSDVLRFIKEWFLEDDNKTGCRVAIVDAKNNEKVLDFYQKNDFKFLFAKEIDEDLYMIQPKDEEERKERIAHPRHLDTRLMFCDLLPKELLLKH